MSKQCPFCACKSTSLTQIKVDDTYFIQCNNIYCGAQGPITTKDKAIEFWNRRYTEEKDVD